MPSKKLQNKENLEAYIRKLRKEQKLREQREVAKIGEWLMTGFNLTKTDPETGEKRKMNAEEWLEALENYGLVVRLFNRKGGEIKCRHYEELAKTTETQETKTQQ